MKILLIASALFFSGCAMRLVREKTVIVPASKNPTVVQMRATAVDTDYVLFRTLNVDIVEVPQSADATKAK